jgi:hypothetical protein
MARTVSHRYLAAHARVRAQVSPCGICSGQSGTGRGFSEFFCFLPWLSMLIHHLEDEQ